MNHTQTVLAASLHCGEGNSDKVYHAFVESRDDGYVVTFAYGRRGNTLNTGTKTQSPVSLEQAQSIHKKLVASKLAKGYKPDGEEVTPCQQTGEEGRDSGIRCQLLNPVDESELNRLLTDNQHCIQEKFDGRRLMVRKQGEEVIGINRRGLVVALPDPIRRAVEKLPIEVLIDGEAVGETLHVFDLLELDGYDQRSVRYIDRFVRLQRILPKKSAVLRPVATYMAASDKLRVFEEFKANRCEGVVLKNKDAPFSPSRPNSGGTQLKYKFVESASFIVTSHNDKRSVTLCLYDGEVLVGAGNVTIPPNHEVPAVGDVIEARFLYAMRKSGSIYQPVYLGKRCDIPAYDCTVDQLKYKAD